MLQLHLDTKLIWCSTSFFTPPPYFTQFIYVCMSDLPVCLLISKTSRLNLHEIFSACWLCRWLGPECNMLYTIIFVDDIFSHSRADRSSVSGAYAQSDWPCESPWLTYLLWPGSKFGIHHCLILWIYCATRWLELVLLRCQAAVVEETWVLNTLSSGRLPSLNWCLVYMTFSTTCTAQLKPVCVSWLLFVITAGSYHALFCLCLSANVIIIIHIFV